MEALGPECRMDQGDGTLGRHDQRSAHTSSADDVHLEVPWNLMFVTDVGRLVQDKAMVTDPGKEVRYGIDLLDPLGTLHVP